MLEYLSAIVFSFCVRKKHHAIFSTLTLCNLDSSLCLQLLTEAKLVLYAKFTYCMYRPAICRQQNVKKKWHWPELPIFLD